MVIDDVPDAFQDFSTAVWAWLRKVPDQLRTRQPEKHEVLRLRRHASRPVRGWDPCPWADR